MVYQPRRVRDMVMRLVDRVGHVDHSTGVIPREIRQQQWLFLNISPSCGRLPRGQWLVASARPSDRVGFSSRSNAGVGLRSREGVAEKVSPRWEAHFSGRAQERLLNAAVAHDARDTGSESACFPSCYCAALRANGNIGMDEMSCAPDSTSQRAEFLEEAQHSVASSHNQIPTEGCFWQGSHPSIDGHVCFQQIFLSCLREKKKKRTTPENNQLRAKFWIAWREQQIPQ